MKHTKSLTCAALCLALCYLLPFLTAQNQELGTMLCPMYIPVLLCGYLCGWPWGLAVGLIAPVTRSLIFGMPPLYPIAVGMCFELAAYGLVTGILYRKLPAKKGYVYLTLAVALVIGRVVWGLSRYAMMGLVGTAFSLNMFLTGALVSSWPGILLDFAVVPSVVFALEKARILARAANGNKASL